MAPAPGPIDLQLAWRSAAGRDAEAASPAARFRQAAPVANPASTTTVEAQAAGTAPAAQASALAEADTGERELLITLRNQTVSDLRIAPGGIRLVGVGRDGRAVWRRTLRPESDTIVPAERSLSWVQPMAVLPPGIARLRLEVDGQRSTEIMP